MRTRLLIAVGVLLLLVLCAQYTAGPPNSNPPPEESREEPAPHMVDVHEGGPGHASKENGEVGNPTGKSPDLRITGHVVMSSTQKPLEDVTVTAWEQDHLLRKGPSVKRIMEIADPGFWVETHPPRRPVAEARTDREGAFVLEVPREGTYSVLAAKARFGGDTAVVQSGGRVHMQLDVPAELRFRIVDPEGAPVQGVEVLVFGHYRCEPPRARKVSDAKGEVLLRTHGHGLEMVLLRRAGYESRLLEVAEIRRFGNLVILEHGSPIAGEVRDQEGRPVEGAAVLLDHAYPDLRITGPDGRFSFDGACVSLYDGSIASPRGVPGLYVSHPDYQMEENWNIPKQGDLTVTLSRRGTARITGRIVPVDGTRSEFEVRVGPYRDRWPVALRDDATFTVSALPPGTVRLVLKCLKAVPTFRGSPENCITHLREATVTLEAGQHMKNLVIKPEPRELSFVSPRAVDSEGRHLKEVRFETEELGSSVSGRWFALHVAPGSSVPFTVQHPRTEEFATRETVNLVTSADPSVPPVDVVLRRNPRFTFELTDTEGRAIPSVSVDFGIAQGGRSWGVVRSPDTPNVVASPLDPEQGFRIKAAAIGYGTVVEYREPPDPNHPRLKVVFRRESSVLGRLVTPGGRPVRRALLRVSRLFAKERPVIVAGTGHLGADGRFSIPGVPAGRARITVYANNSTDAQILAETTVEVPPGETADVGTLVMGSLPVVCGAVTDSQGRELGGVRICFYDETGDWYETQTTTRADGTFRLKVPRRPGSCLDFESTGYLLRTLRLTPAHFKNAVTVCLTPSGE